MPTGNGENHFTDSEQMKTPKTDCLLQIQQDKEVYQLGFQVCRPRKYRAACHLNAAHTDVTCSGLAHHAETFA